MLRNLHLLIVSVLLSVAYSFSQSGLGTIKGSVIDGDTREPIPFAKVLLLQNGTVKGGANTDDDGGFQVNSLAPGSYDVEVRNEGDGYQPTALTGVIVSADRITFLDNTEITKPKDVKNIDDLVIVAYKVPLINKDGGASGATVTREDISRLPVRSAAGVAQTVGGVNTDEGSGEISVRGSRSDATYYYIDGIKVRGSSNLPKSAIEEVSVITGGLPANYGDVTGGIISVTTRGPSSKYFGSIEGVTSGFYFKGKDKDGYDGKAYGLDRYAYNMVEGMFSGPLFMKKDSTGAKVKPILGFLVSGSYLNEVDNRPLNGGSYRIKKEMRDSLMNSPLVLVPDASGQDQSILRATLLRQNDFENTKHRMNARSQTISAQAKIDVNTGPSVNLSFGGSLNYHDRSLYNRNSSLFNFQNFGQAKTLDWRVFGRLTQRFTNTKEGSSSKVKSANYSLMVDYSQTRQSSFDPKHGFNLFNYGHVGRFDVRMDTTLVWNDTLGVYAQDAVPFPNGMTYTASETNPGLSSYTNAYYSLFGGARDINQLRNGNGLMNGDSPNPVYNMWNNLGTPYNGFGVAENNQFRVTGSGSVNIGDHSISLGFEYEQRTDRSWEQGDAGPIGIWNNARLRMNSHISELDVTNPTIVNGDGFTAHYYNRLNTGYAYNNDGIYGGARSGATGGQVDYQSFFDYNVRKALGMDPGSSDYVNIDQYDPSMFGFDMFAPDELLNNGSSFISYFGYDHAGNKVKGRTDIDKYFTEFDENGNYKRFVGAFQPTYISGYIMDKFAFRDLVFNVGVRVDVFDANQPVLKDRFLMHTAKTVAEARSEAANAANPQDYDWVQLPGSMGDDYIVYVNDVSDPSKINGFRNGDTWYNANGDVIEDPKVIRGAAGIAPWLHDGNNRTINSSAFEDYKAQISVMPRIAFSFPVSEESSFFAHYDILTKRPTTGVRFDPYEYQFIQTRNRVINNSNLKPEKTIDYELGFQQVLTRTSSIKISAFYRELRDNVQMINVVEAYPVTYKTFGNRDFGTVKGLTVAYDLRRTKNIRMTAAYTLQFADGTGSDATSMEGLINAGLPNLRAIFPFSYDQRHAFAISIDYRYGSGANYNGPRIKDFEVFANTGINLMTNIYSGNPYSRKLDIVDEALFSPQYNSGLDGSTNGSRLPWSYRLDLQIDRTFDIEIGKNEDKKRTTFLNVYFRITNLFNQKNVLSVYRATGNWNDDGFLEASKSQATIQNQNDAQSFRDYYMMKIQNPYNISAPRTIRLGVKFDF